MVRKPRPGKLLTAGEVAQIFGVSLRAVRQWADDGRLPCVKTLGGHRRFPREVVKEIYEQQTLTKEARPT